MGKKAEKDGKKMVCYEIGNPFLWDIPRGNTGPKDQHTCEPLAELAGDGTFDYGVDDPESEEPSKKRLEEWGIGAEK